MLTSAVTFRLTVQAAEKELSGTVSSEKNELLFTQFNMNYNKELEMFRKGSTLVWSEIEVSTLLPVNCLSGSSIIHFASLPRGLIF